MKVFFAAGFDLSNCSKTMRVIIKTRRYKRQQKASHQGMYSVLWKGKVVVLQNSK